MSGDPNAEHGDVDGRYEACCSPFQQADGILALSDDRYPVDDNLHEQLDLKDPEKEEEEEYSHAGKTPVNIWSFREPQKKISQAYESLITPCRKSHPRIPMQRLATISPHTM